MKKKKIYSLLRNRSLNASVPFYPTFRFTPLYPTSGDFLPEEQSTVTWLPSSWEVRIKVSCDALTSVVSTSKPTLEESFQARADIFITSDEESKPIV